MSSSKSAFVITIDGLSAPYLGPYGDASQTTPHINRAAASSTLWETCWSDSNSLARTFRSYWQGRHAWCPADKGAPWLPELLGDQASRLLTDDEDVATHSGAERFSDVVLLHSMSDDSDRECASDIDNTRIVQFAAQVAEAWEELPATPLQWIHARGMCGPWDAPWDLRASFTDDEEPDPPDFVHPPVMRVDADGDPDLLWGIKHAYMAQLVAVDLAVGILTAAIQRTAPQALLLVTAPRGYPLGARSVVGWDTNSMSSESLHVPCLIRVPHDEFPRRVHGLVQPADLFATLVEWFTGQAPPATWGAHSLWPTLNDNRPTAADRAVALSLQDQQITGVATRTKAWLTIAPYNDLDAADQSARLAAGGTQLFCKPDDRWDQNEVASLCGDEARLMRQATDAFRQAAVQGALDQLAPLPRELVANHD